MSCLFFMPREVRHVLLNLKDNLRRLRLLIGSSPCFSNITEAGGATPLANLSINEI